MCRTIVVVLLSVLCLAGCSQTGSLPASPAAPLAPSAVLSPAPASASDVEVPFHSEVAWTSYTVGHDTGLCPYPPPAGKVYVMRNTNQGTHITTHLGEGAYENHTCVYSTTAGGSPEGWIADVHWTAANGDVLLAKSTFQYWTGTPGKSRAIDTFEFENGGTGRFQFAEGGGTAFVDTQTSLAGNDGVLRYGRMQK